MRRRNLLMGIWRCSAFQWQLYDGFAAFSVGAIVQRNTAAMSLGDLPAKSQADAGPTGLGGEEGHEQVRRIGDSGTFVLHEEMEPTSVSGPADSDFPAILERGVNRVADQINQQLLELVGVGFQCDVRP